MYRQYIFAGFLVFFLSGQSKTAGFLPTLDSLDKALSLRLQGSNQHPLLDVGLEAWALGTPFIEIGTALAFSRYNPHAARQILIGETLAGITSFSIKIFINRERPSRKYRPRLWNTRLTPSFPSGHMAAFATFMTLLTGNDPGLAAPAALGLTTLTGYTQIYNGNHYTGDILAGTLLGYALGKTIRTIF